MAFFSDLTLDAACQYLIDNGSRIDICSQEPVSYSEATTGGAYSLGNKTGLTLTGPADGTSGRKATVPAITDGSITDSDTATHWALTDGASLLLATGALSAPQAVTASNTFTLDAIILDFADPT